MAPDPLTAVWNRACGLGEASSALGDRALRAIVLFDGVAQNGGLLHAIQHFDTEELDEVTAGFAYFELSEVGPLLADARAADVSALSDDQWNEFDRRYWAVAPADALWAAFTDKLSQQPDDFASV